MSHTCCIDGCSKIKVGGASSESDFRCFIRWYKFPKNKGMQRKWMKRVNRPTNDVQSMYICSDHFEDEDFVYRNLLQAEMLSSDALDGHQIKLKDDAVPNTDRKTGHLRLGPPKAMRALKRCQNVIPANKESEVSPSRKRLCHKLNFKTVDELISENETIVGTLPSLCSGNRDTNLEKNKGVASRNSRKFSLSSIDDIISENEALIGDLKSMTKSTSTTDTSLYKANISEQSAKARGYSLQTHYRPGELNLKPMTKSTSATDTSLYKADLSDQSAKVKGYSFQTHFRPGELNRSAPNTLISTAIRQALSVKEDPMDSKQIKNFGGDINLSQFVSGFMGDLPSSKSGAGVVSSYPATHSNSLAHQPALVKQEPADVPLQHFINKSKDVESFSDSSAVIKDLSSNIKALESSLLTLESPTDCIKKEPVDSNLTSNNHFIQNINNLISENEKIIGKFPEKSTGQHYDIQDDSKISSPAASSSRSDSDSLKVSKQNPIRPNDSPPVGSFSLRSIDALIAENEAIVGSDSSTLSYPVTQLQLSHTPITQPNDSKAFPMLPSDSVKRDPSTSDSSRDDDGFGFHDINSIKLEKESPTGIVLPLIPSESDVVPDYRGQHRPTQYHVSNKFNEYLKTLHSNEHSNIRNIDEIISENEAIISNSPPVGTVFSVPHNDNFITDISSSSNVKGRNSAGTINKVGPRRYLSAGYIDELISENEEILGKTAL